MTQDALLAFDHYGNITLLHMADLHAQLMPIYLREPAVNIGGGEPTLKRPDTGFITGCRLNSSRYSKRHAEGESHHCCSGIFHSPNPNLILFGSSHKLPE
jgi:2',3'-cyclic-nucleotide 2'-phosphodiesterase (5'-nucleotidase family)